MPFGFLLYPKLYHQLVRILSWDFPQTLTLPRSGTELKFPTAIGCFDSFSKPDFAARINATHIKQNLRPLVILGEAKKDFYTYTSRSEAHMQTVAAQLAWSAQPTLTIMIMAAIGAHKRRIETTNGSKNVVSISSVPSPRFTRCSCPAPVPPSRSCIYLRSCL